jgi:hypothetical protein
MQETNREFDPFETGVRLGIDKICASLNRVAEQLERYNNAHAPIIYRSEAEVFKASYEREKPGARELHDFLTGKEASDTVGRSSAEEGGRGKKKTRSNRRNAGGDA